MKWVHRWTPRVDAAAAGLANLLAELPEVSRDVDTTVAAAKAARERVLSESGILAVID